MVLHARNKKRAEDAMRFNPRAETAVPGDLSSLKEMRSVAAQVNELGAFDSIIHNAAVGYQEPKIETEDGLPHVFAINALAPYVLTALIKKPKRIIYLSSGLHQSAETSLDDILWSKRRWQGGAAYSESKFFDALLAFAVARLFPGVLSNALEPGWVPTKMGGAGAPDDLDAGCETQAWLAVSEDADALLSGEYFYHQRLRAPNPATRDSKKQDAFLELCRGISGVALSPGN